LGAGWRVGPVLPCPVCSTSGAVRSLTLHGVAVFTARINRTARPALLHGMAWHGGRWRAWMPCPSRSLLLFRLVSSGACGSSSSTRSSKQFPSLAAQEGAEVCAPPPAFCSVRRGARHEKPRPPASASLAVDRSRLLPVPVPPVFVSIHRQLSPSSRRKA
jgi:hypothetical protein